MKATLYGMSHPLGTRKLPVEFPVEKSGFHPSEGTGAGTSPVRVLRTKSSG